MVCKQGGYCVSDSNYHGNRAVFYFASCKWISAGSDGKDHTGFRYCSNLLHVNHVLFQCHVGQSGKLFPFTYTVTAFRSAISGGAGIGRELGVLIALTVIFTLLTAVLFWYRANRIKAGKTILYTWIEEHTMGA